MKKLEGGCSVPLGICSELTCNDMNIYKLSLQGSVTSLDGLKQVIDTVQVEFSALLPKDQQLTESDNLGQLLANQLIEQGAQTILEEIKKNTTS